MNQAVPRTDWTWKDAFRVSSTDAIALKVLGTVVALAVVGFAIWLVCLVITDHINDSVAGNVALSLLSVLVAIAGTIVGVVVYVLPTIIAARRNMPHVGSIAVVNVFLGFTYVGWVVALAMAVAGKPVNR